MKFKYNKKIRFKAFTLIELLITIALITILATVSIIIINPQKILADGRDNQRKNDLNSIKLALSRYVSETDSTGTPRHLYNLANYIYLVSDVGYSGSGACAGGSNGITSNISGAYNLAASGSGTVALQPLIDAGYLTKIPQDPSNVNYKVCMDPTNSNKLVLFSPVQETGSTFISTTVDISPSPNINYIPNPSSATDNIGWGVSADPSTGVVNDTITNVSVGSSYLTKTGNTYFNVSPISNTYKTTYIQAIGGGSLPSYFFVPGATYTFSVDVDKGSYTGVMHIELKDYIGGGNWQTTNTVINTPGRYSVTRTIRSTAYQLQAVISGDGQPSGDTLGSYYFDNAQLEISSIATNYFDGDSGAPNYGWVYNPHFHGAYKFE